VCEKGTGVHNGDSLSSHLRAGMCTTVTASPPTWVRYVHNGDILSSHPKGKQA